MEMLKKCLDVFLCFILLISLTSCASIIHGSRQEISISSNPPGAVVKVNGTVTTTPGVVNLDRSRVAYILRFEKEGYEPVQVKLKRSVDGWVWGNIIFGGIVGLVIDFASGSAYKLSPKEVEVTLRKQGYSLNILEEKGDLLVFVDMVQSRDHN